MTTPRRRIVRPGPAHAPAANTGRLVKVHEKLDNERASLDRWMSRLKRAFNALQKHQRRVAHLERRIRHLESP